MSPTKRILIPLGAGLAGVFFLTGLYFGFMVWAEGFKVAREVFWSDRWIVIPIVTGFGIQAALYAVLKFRLFVPVSATGPSGALMGATGTTSTAAMTATLGWKIPSLFKAFTAFSIRNFFWFKSG